VIVAACLAAAGLGGLWHEAAGRPPPEACRALDDRLPGPGAGMVWIPGGRFRMGSENFRAEEAPIREAAVEGFWMDEEDVTNAQFDRFVRATGYVTLAERGGGGWVFAAPDAAGDARDIGQWWQRVAGASWRHPEGPGSDLATRPNHPVVQIAFEDALAYASWAGRALPSEAEWEFAARGGRDGADFSWGEAPDIDDAPQANHWRGGFPTENLGSKGYRGTSPVGCFPANGYGLHDMAGNVWQWTRDPWTDDHAGTDAPADRRHVIKGGSFLCAPNYCMRYRPASRQPGEAGSGASHIGFRTVLIPLRNGAAQDGRF
jgi:sulfatase modifying factor 1